MAILNFGDHLPPVYLERFNPPENQVVRISLLALQSVGVESHWVDLPTLGIKGMYRCTGGVCCSSGAFGRRSQYYHVPVYVYNNPRQSAEGQLMDWSLTKTIYDTLVSLAQRYNLMEYDLDVVRTVQGQGTRTNFTIVPDVKMRAYWTPEQQQKIAESVQMFFQVADTTLVQEANDQIYMEMLTNAGYNFETKQFPQLAAPAYHGANVAISQAVVPPMGIGQRPSAPAMNLPGSQPSGIMPPPPQIQNGSPLPLNTGSPAPVGTVTTAQAQTSSPAPLNTGSPTPLNTGSPAPAQTTTGTPNPVTTGAPQMQVPPQTFGQMPNATPQPQFTSQPIPQTSFPNMATVGQPDSAAPSNTIPQVQATELSATDIDALLGDDSSDL